MLSRIAESALAMGKARVGVLTRSNRTFSSQVGKYAAPVSPLNAFAQTWYNLFGASTARYATFLAVGVVMAEMGTNKLTDFLWETNNEGKTYKQVDWSKFDPPDEDEDDDDDDDE